MIFPIPIWLEKPKKHLSTVSVDGKEYDRMSVFEIIGGILIILFSIAIALFVLMQEGTKGGVSTLTGGDSYYNKNQGRTSDALLARGTKYAAIAFFLVTILVYAADVYLG